MTPKHILLINVHSADNPGDLALNQVAIALLRQTFPEAAITLMMNDPDRDGRLGDDLAVVESFTYWMKQPARSQTGWRLLSGMTALLYALFYLKRPLGRRSFTGHETINAYREADLIVSCPGNFLYSSGRFGLTLILALYSIIYGVWLGKPVYLLPQTIGPLRKRWERALTGAVLRRVRLIFVRDQLSFELVTRDLAIPQAQVRLVPDVAFAHRVGDLAQGRALLQRLHIPDEPAVPTLGVTLINWGAQNRLFTNQTKYEAGVAAGIERFVQETGGRVILFSQVHGPKTADDDRLPARRVYEQLGRWHEQVFFIEEPLTPEQLQSAYGLMDLFVGSRLHSLIFATAMHTPALALQYQYKTTGIMRMLDLERWILPLEAIDPHSFPPFLLAGWAAREEIRAVVTEQLSQLVSQIEQIPQVIAADWDASAANGGKIGP